MSTPESRNNIRHEIRTLLNHIVGYAEILLEDASFHKDTELSGVLEDLRTKSLALREPILQFFATSAEIPAGSPEMEARTRGIHGLLYDAISQIQTARRTCQSENNESFLPDLQKILEAANATAELFEGALADTLDPDDLADQAAAKAEDSMESSRLPGSILVVDDDTFNREILTRHLERQGHTVHQAADGAMALEILKKDAHDLILLDVMMPVMNGYQFLERIKKLPGLRDIPVIVISVLEESRSVARCLRLGAEDYLPREFDPVVLRARIDSCLERGRLRVREQLSLLAVETAQRRLTVELKRAAEYVRSLLPRRGQWRGLRTEWTFLPSRDLGGDAFGYARLDDGQTALFLLDVSGHGIEAALLSVSLLHRVNSQSRSNPGLWDPARILSELNQTYRSEDQNSLFFSAWFGLWNPETRSLRYASAGAPPAALLPKVGKVTKLGTNSPAVGVDEQAVYENAETEIPVGSILFLFSDGIFEIRCSMERILGLEGFLSILQVANRRPEGADVNSIVESVRNACERAQFEDDVSLVGFYFDA